MRILVVGASGYVGGRLVPLLAARGHELILMSRDARPLAARFAHATVVAADLLDPSTLPVALERVDVTYYLAHSMGAGERGFADRDRQAARNFAQAAKGAGVSRIIYLGGLGDDSADLSHHLASRHETGAQLAAHGVPVTEFRAAVVIGSGSASFEILRHLTERLPIMITPRWVGTRCQPIGIADVLDYLVGALDHPEVTGVVEVGGPDILSYGDMMRGYARLRGLRRLMIPVPVLTPRLSSYWVNLISPVPAGIAQPLIEGLRNEVVVQHPGPAAAFGLHPLPYVEALGEAIDRVDRHDVESTWFDALAGSDRATLSSVTASEGMIVERRGRFVVALPERVFAEVERLGGDAGWPSANVLWRIRGLVDRLAGGVGMRLGRRDPDHLRVGDALDFWRVEELRRPSLLRLRAEMKVPGRAWLQYEVTATDGGSRLVQTAFFEPKGLPGLVYWYALYPVHGLIFRGTVRVLADRADRRAERGHRARPMRSSSNSGAGSRKGTAAMMTQRFPIHLGRRSQLVLLLFGVRPSNAYVDLADDELDAHFGFFRFRTPTSNLASWRIEGPWRWITAIGVRFSVRQHDLTFGGTNRGGVRVDFREPVSQLGVRVPALYLTLEDIEGFAAALAKRGLPGGDARKPAPLPPPAMPDAGQDDTRAHAADRDPRAIISRRKHRRPI